MMKIVEHRTLAWSPVLAFVGFLGLVSPCLEVRADDVERRVRGLGPVFSQDYSFDGRRLLIVDGNEAILWDLETGEELRQFRGQTERVHAATLSPDGSQVVAGGGRVVDMGIPPKDNWAILWDVATTRELQRFQGHDGIVHTVKFSPDGRRILTIGSDSTARLWDPLTGRERFKFPGVQSVSAKASSLSAFSPDSASILSLIAGGFRLKVWDVETGEERLTIERDGGLFISAEFSPDGKTILTASTSKVARTWDATTGKQVMAFTGHTDFVLHAIFTDEGRKVVTASQDKTIRFWNATTGDEIRRLVNPGSVDEILATASGSRVLAKWQNIFTDQSGVLLWDATSDRELKRWDEPGLEAVVGFSPDGKKIPIVNITNGRCVRIFDAETGQEIPRKK
jgi:WD40 repeat protein